MADTPQGTPEPKSEQGEKEQTPKYLTEEEVNTKANQIVTSHLKKFEKRMEELLAAKSKPATASEDEAKPTPRELRLENELNEFKTKYDQKEKSMADKNLRSELTEQLLKASFNAEYIDHVVGYLVDSKKLVQLDDDGVPVILIKDKKVALAKGLAEWAGTSEAQIYKNPKGTTGSGDTSKKPNKQGKADIDIWAKLSKNAF